MSDKQDVTISISADASGVEAGVAKTKKSLKTLGGAANEMAGQMETGGKRAAAGIESIGTSSTKTAREIERATKTSARELQRQIAELKAGGKATREYAEAVARLRGADLTTLRPLLDQLDELKRKQQEAASASTDFVSSLGGMKQALAAVGAASVTAKFVQVADAVVTLNNQLKLATGSTQAAASAYNSLFDIAQRSRVGFVELGETYASIARAAAPLGVSQERLLKVTESIGNAMTISGGSAQGLQAALVQLGQGLSSGVLRGEELNSVMEQAPRLAKALADGLGVTTGQLRAMGAEGEITAEKVIRALESQSAVLKGEVAGSALTVGQAFTQLSNSSIKAVGDFDLASGASSTLAQAISSIATTMDGLGGAFARNEPIIKTTMGALAGGAALATLTAMPRAIGAVGGAITALGAVLAANPVVLGLLGVGAVVGGGIGAINAYKKTADGIRSTIDALEKENARAQKALDWSAGMGGSYQKADDRTRQLIAERAAQVEKLRDELRKLDAGEVTGAGGGRGAVNPPTIAESNAKLAQQEEALTEARRKLHGISKDYLSELKKLNELYTSGAMPLDEYRQHVAKLATDTYNASTAGKAEAKAAREAAKGLKDGESAILSYIKSLEARTAAQRLEIAQGDKLTESQRARIQLESLLADKKNKATASQIAYAKAQLTEAEANEAWLKNASEVTKALTDMQKAREQSLRSVQDSVRKLVEEAEAAAFAEANNVSLAEAIERLALARAENAYQQALERQESPATLEALEKELQARKKIVELTAQKGVREANKKAQDQIAKDWDRTAQTIGDTLADYIMGGGKDAATYLKRLFSTLVLQPVVQYGVQGVLGAIGMGGGSAGGANDALGMLNNLNSLKNAWGYASQLFGFGGAAGGIGFGSGIGLGLGTTSAGLTVGTTASLGASGAGLGVGAGYGVGGGSASSVGSLGGMSSAWPLAIVAGMIASNKLFDAGYSAKNFDGGQKVIGAGKALETNILGKLVGEKTANILTGAPVMSYTLGKLGIGGVTPHAGAASEYRDGVAFGNATTAQNLVNAGDSYIKSMQSTVDGLAFGIGSALDGLADSFGKQSGFYVGTGFTSDGKDPSSGYFNLTTPDGETIDRWKISRKDPKYTSRGKSGYSAKAGKGYDEYLKDAADAALRGVFDLVPDWADDMVTSVRDSLGDMNGAQAIEAFQGVIGQIYAVKEAFKTLGESIGMFADISGEVESILLRVSGGMEALTQSASTYYDLYYSDQEKQADAVRRFNDAIASYGVTLPTTREEYRKLIEQQMAAGESGAELAAVLLKLSEDFASISDVWTAELGLMSASVSDFFSGLHDSIATVSEDVANSRKDILRGADVMSADAIRAAIAGSALALPGVSSVDAATVAASAAMARVSQAQATYDAAAKNQSLVKTPMHVTERQRADVQKQIAAADAKIAELRTVGGSLVKRLKAAREIATQEAIKTGLNSRLADISRLMKSQQNAYSEVADEAAEAAKKLAEAQDALKAAQEAELSAKADYAAQVAQYVADAGNSVSKLSDLRGEVVSFYEAQAQAVQAMLQSAGNIRGVVDQVRLSQLSPEQTAQELGARYAMDYSMALATTGSARAGYVDAMAGNLAGLSEALKAEAATGEDWRIETAKLFAQASNAAGLLEGDAESDDYQDVALGLLDSIDTALAGLSGATKTAEQVIADSVNNGTQAQLEGLRAIVAALTGKSIPAFAAGGLHAGGMRLVGERGPELEVTGPARYWNANQTQAMLGGGGNTARLEVLVEQLIEENRAQASAIVRLQQDLNRQVMRWDTQGLPREREEA